MIPLSNLGLAQLLRGNSPDARAAFVEALKLCTSEAFRWAGAESLAGLAALLVVEDRLEQAAHLLGAAKAAGYPGPDPDDQDMLRRLERDHFDSARARLSPATWTQLARSAQSSRSPKQSRSRSPSRPTSIRPPRRSARAWLGYEFRDVDSPSLVPALPHGTRAGCAGHPGRAPAIGPCPAAVAIAKPIVSARGSERLDCVNGMLSASASGRRLLSSSMTLSR